jgi:diaminopimelate decarboxylase
MNALLAAIAEKRGTPCFVYLADVLKERAEALRAAFGGRVRICFPVRANPHPSILGRLAGVVDLFDAASAGEMKSARAAGLAGPRLLLSGPGPRTADFAAVVESRGATVVLDSLDAARLLDRVVAGSLGGAPVPVLLRLPAPKGPLDPGGPTPFGIDEGDLAETARAVRAMPRLALEGFAVRPAGRSADGAVLGEHLCALAALLRGTAEALAFEPKRLLLGAGFAPGGPSDEDRLDPAKVAKIALPAIEGLAPAEVVLETGRYLAGPAGLYLSRVLSVKRSRGALVAILDGGPHHRPATEPEPPVFRLRSEPPGEARQAHDLAGPLPAGDDWLGRGVELPELRPGDVLAFGDSGAYGPAASPLRFALHPLPTEVLVETKGGRPVDEDVSARSPLRG